MIRRTTETTLEIPETSVSFTGASIRILGALKAAFKLTLQGTSGRPEAIRFLTRSELEALGSLVCAALIETQPQVWVNMETGESGPVRS